MIPPLARSPKLGTAPLGAVLLSLVAGCGHAPAPPATAPPAELVITGAAIYTMDADHPRAEAVAVRGGRIVFVGSAAAAEALIGPRTERLALGGRMLLPGFVDAHQHLFPGAFTFDECRLDDLPSAPEVLEAVRRCAARTDGSGWLIGGGWGLTVFPDVNPTRQELDAVVGDRPAFFMAGDYHQAWVSSKALQLAGIDEHTPDPPGGHIERDAAGRPSGTLRDDALRLVERVMPRPGMEGRIAGLGKALAMLHSLGVVAVADAAVGLVSGGLSARAVLETYRETERRGALKLEVVATLAVDPTRGPEQVAALLALRRELESPRVRPTAAKLFLDGVIESHTAALLAPYTDDPTQRGQEIHEPKALYALTRGLLDAGFALHFHAIGDRAVRLGLDALATAGPLAARRAGQHQLAHLELVDPADFARFGALGATATFQALWASADDDIVLKTWPLLGPARSRWIYPIGSLARAGAPLAFGSDWPVSSPAPLEAIQVALTRQAIDPPRRPPMYAEEAIDLGTALRAYTLGSARALGLEAELGSIEVGKRAHLVVLSADLFTVPPTQLAQQRVLLTLFDGQPVYRAPE